MLGSRKQLVEYPNNQDRTAPVDNEQLKNSKRRLAKKTTEGKLSGKEEGFFELANINAIGVLKGTTLAK